MLLSLLGGRFVFFSISRWDSGGAGGSASMIVDISEHFCFVLDLCNQPHHTRLKEQSLQQTNSHGKSRVISYRIIKNYHSRGFHFEYSESIRNKIKSIPSHHPYPKKTTSTLINQALEGAEEAGMTSTTAGPATIVPSSTLSLQLHRTR